MRRSPTFLHKGVYRTTGARYFKTAAIAGAFIAGGMYGFSQFFGQATEAEKKQRYPADDLIDADYDNDYSLTYAITVDAPAYAVWRLFKQIGCDKSGSSSAESMEHAFARLPFYNSYEIQEEFQRPDSLMPGNIAAFDFHDMSIEWADVMPGKYLIQWVGTKNPPAASGSYAFHFPGMTHFTAAQCFYVVPLKGNRTRLINHQRIGYEPATSFVKALNRVNIEPAGGCMANIQNLYARRVVEFKKKGQLHSKAMRGLLGGRFFTSGTPAGRRDGTPFFEDTQIQWMRFGRQSPAVAEIRPPVTDDPTWPPAGPGTPWENEVDEVYFDGWSESAFSWEEQMCQRRERTHLHDWGKNSWAALKAVGPLLWVHSLCICDLVRGNTRIALGAKRMLRSVTSWGVCGI